MEVRELRVHDDDVVHISQDLSFGKGPTAISRNLMSGAAERLSQQNKSLAAWLNNGVKGQLLRQGESWQKGVFKFKLYFVPDEPPKEPDPFK